MAVGAGERDFDEFVRMLSRTVERAGSLADIEAWLRAQPQVTSITTEDYLLKSNPPQRRFLVELSLGETETRRHAIDVFTFDDERFELRDIHEG